MSESIVKVPIERVESVILLIRGEKTLTMVPADEDIPPHLIPHVQLKDLRQRGRTEIVVVRLTKDEHKKFEDNIPERGRWTPPVPPVKAGIDGLFEIRADVRTLRRIFEVEPRK